MRTQLTAAVVLWATCSSTSRACSCATPGNRPTNSLSETPSSTFTSRAPTGMRVPRNTHAPLTSSGPQWPDLIGKGDPHQQIAQGCWIVNVDVVKVGDRDHLNSPSPAPGPEWPAQRGPHCVSGPSAACRPEDHSGGSAGGCPRCERGASLSSVDRSGTDETHSHGDGEGNTRCADDLLKPAEFLRALLAPGLDRGPQRPGGQGQPDRAEGALDAPHPGGGGDQR